MERHVDVLGRVVIPAEIRKSLGIEAPDALRISQTAGGAIILTPTKSLCGLCGRSENLHQVAVWSEAGEPGKPICETCAELVRRTTTPEAIAEHKALLEKLGRA